MAQMFHCPLGPIADKAELEYISALHQSSNPKAVRVNGSIIARDVKNYLMSRHGVDVLEEEVKSKIFNGLSSSPSSSDISIDNYIITMDNLDDTIEGEEEELYLDLSEIVSVLIIPYLLDLSMYILPDRETPTTLSVNTRVIQDVLNHIMQSVNLPTADLNEEAIKKILVSYGETELASNEVLIKQMLNAAKGNTVLNEESFICALTSDVELYDVKNADSYSTHFYDVFQTHDLKSINKTFTESDEESELSEELLPSNNVKVASTGEHIDNQGDSIQSKLFNIILWINYTVTILAYFLNTIDATLWQCGSRSDTYHYLCMYGLYVAYYALQFILYSIIGTVYICLSSLGNGAKSTKENQLLYFVVSILTIVVFNIVPFLIEVDIGILSTVKISDSYISIFCYLTSFILGWILILIRILLYFLNHVDTNDRKRWFIMEDSIAGERCIKQAASFKINQMVTYAHQLLPKQSTSSRTNDENILHYIQETSKTKLAGGILFTIKGLVLSEKLYKEEGIWISSRILSCFYASVFVIIACALIGATSIRLATPLPDHGLFTDETNFWVSSIVGTVFAVVNAIYLSIVLIPSTVTQTLKLRYGLTPTLRDESHYAGRNIARDGWGGDRNFLLCRRTVESVCTLFPCSFWGPLVSSLFVGFLIFFALYFFVEVTGTVLGKAIYSQIFALITTTLISLVILLSLRKVFFKAFYRNNNVLAANVFIVVVQCWYLALSILQTLTRFLILASLAFIYAGRIDRPFLAPGVDFLDLDKLPMTFMKDILMHEAHRHPYIERLGVMYMMKLRHGSKFANTAGSVWRLIFVLAMMPWLRMYRITKSNVRRVHQLSQT